METTKTNEAAAALEQAVEAAIDALGHHLVLGAPLGIGKPNPLLNAFYRRAAADPELRLDVFTALSLAVPPAGGGLKGRFARPFLARHFGDYPHLEWLADLKSDNLPPNVTVSEFYLQPGSMLGRPAAQRRYVSSNYTHVARDMERRGVNLICQAVAARDTPHGRMLSLSSNPDVTLDLIDRLKKGQRPYYTIALVNRHLPYMAGDAEVPASTFDRVLDDPALDYLPFAPPRAPIDLADHAIGLYASLLVADGGTLQIGIGSLGESLAHFLLHRQHHNADWRALCAAVLDEPTRDLVSHWGGLEPFAKGLYAASEMFMDAFIHLYRGGILKRRVYDDLHLQELLNGGAIDEIPSPAMLAALYRAGKIAAPLSPDDLAWLQHWGIIDSTVTLQDGILLAPGGERVPADPRHGDAARWGPILGPRLSHGKLLHAAFFLGSRWFYETLSALPADERALFAMCRVSRINQLYQGEALDRAQRLESRFMNTTMKMTLLGAAASETLANGQVVSGVGGQYNFVAMAHALERSRSILLLRATRRQNGKLESNIVWEYPQVTIPRHLRDLVVTEYGIADLRNKSDEEVIIALLAIADARFQEDLLAAAHSAGKIDPAWRLPPEFRRNTPDELARRLAPHARLLPRWPFGSDFDELELRLLNALQWLAAHQSRPLALWRAWRAGRTAGDRTFEARWRERLGFHEPLAFKDRLQARLVRGALHLATPDAPVIHTGDDATGRQVTKK